MFGATHVVAPAFEPGAVADAIEEIRSWCRERISAYKIPHAVVVHTIPRNPSGKIQKHVLRAVLEDAKDAGRASEGVPTPR